MYFHLLTLCTYIHGTATTAKQSLRATFLTTTIILNSILSYHLEKKQTKYYLYTNTIKDIIRRYLRKRSLEKIEVFLKNKLQFAYITSNIRIRKLMIK